MKSFVVYDSKGDWLNDYDTLEQAEKFSETYAKNSPESTPISVFRKCAVFSAVTTIKVSYE